MRINVICGGQSSERDVSLRSGAAVTNALEAAGHTVLVHDIHVNDAALRECEVVFPVLHGLGGEDGAVQSRLESLGVPYVGSRPDACKLTFDKSQFKQSMQDAGMRTPRWALVHDWDLKEHELAQHPFVLKPYDGGSSIDTFIVRDVSAADWDTMLRVLSDTHGEMLLEELIEGTEVTVGVLETQALPVIEIIPPKDSEFDYQNKYNGRTQELCPPQHISNEAQRELQKLAEQIHERTGCRDMSRTDFITTASGEHYLLETNTIPGLTNESLYPKGAAAAGLSFSQLVDKLVTLAVNR